MPLSLRSAIPLSKDRPLTTCVNIGGNEYTTAPPSQQPQSQHSSSQADLSSPSNVRYTQQFYPSYPSQPTAGGAQMPAVPDAMEPNVPSHASTLATPITASVKEEDDEKKRHLFGDVPESKRRKFILVDDNQRGTRVRVRVMLDQVNMDEMPDAHLRTNAVYPRSYYPRQMRSPPGSPRGLGHWDDEDDLVEGPERPKGTTLVPVSLMDGTDAKLPVPRMTKSRRSKESALNELGYRMSWSQARQFNGRTLFLQRSRKLILQFSYIRAKKLTGLQLTLTATRCAAPWSPAVKTSLLLHHTLRLALARESGWRGPSAIDAVKTRLERIQYEESSPDSPTRPSYNEERQRNNATRPRR
jgi:hypothetical protein